MRRSLHDGRGSLFNFCAHDGPPELTEALRVWSAKGATLFRKTALASCQARKNSFSRPFFTPPLLRDWSAKRAAPRLLSEWQWPFQGCRNGILGRGKQHFLPS